MSFRIESLIPSASEIFTSHSNVNMKKFLRMHTDAYKSTDEYLERSFYLLREDCFRHLKIAINKIRSRKVDKIKVMDEVSNVWIYYNVVISNYSFNHEDIVNKITFQSSEEIEWTDGKRFIFGSLLFLSDDYFNTYHIATVAESNPEELKAGCLKIQFLEFPNNLQKLIKEKFQMIETQTYFESYAHVLKQLQNFNEKTFPFPDYFLKRKMNPKIPNYLNGYGINLDRNNDLNASQKLAFETALSQNLSIIQGPPGTGKTTVGVEILKTILNKYHMNYLKKPILVICYTNHALDQFLESIIIKCGSINAIRIGSQSKNDVVNKFSINKIVQKWKTERKFPKYICYQRKENRIMLNKLKETFKNKIAKNDFISKEEYIEYEDLLRKFKGLGMKEHKMVMEAATIIGMTTTGCARYALILEEIGIPVVIVEEAAEILEANLICSLNSNCEQLIMIGDHKQLQPSCTVYEFNDLYDLNCSLFERLIDTGFKCVTLSEQRRMRPEISVCVSTIYPKLRDHPDVRKFPNVNGFRTNIYFFDHQKCESTLSKSYKNDFEVNFVSRICSFLINRGIKEEKITILSTYRGQNLAIKNKIKNEITRNIKCFVVDNYQGEENDIIVLSLVRSNNENKIGFLKRENRICVALSRAKHGLFIVGNLNCLKQYPLWLSLSKILQSKIGTSIPIKCKQNINHDLFITCLEDFQKKNLCHFQCNKLNNCGIHFCPQLCHDGNHAPCETIVKKMCSRNRHEHEIKCHKNVVCKSETYSDLKCDHKASHICCENIPEKCIEMVSVRLRCSHTQRVLCGTDKSKVVCNKRFEQILKCGHTYIDCIQYVGLCNREIDFLNNCGHKITIKCFEQNTKLKCDKVCNKRMVCGHIYKHFCIDCDGGQSHKKCEEIIEHQLPCKHMKDIRCSDRGLYHKCFDVCSKTMKCGHLCNNSCMDCNGGQSHKPCKEIVEHKLPCKHMKTIKCSEISLDHACYEICNKGMTCGHVCQDTCKSCNGGQMHKPCNELILHDLQCSHTSKIKCFQKQFPVTCNDICNKKMICGHVCKHICKDCDGGNIHKPCFELISYLLPCQHYKKIKCSEKNNPHTCFEICNKRMTCGHKCNHLCKDCDGGLIHKNCNEVISHFLPCQHNKLIKCFEKDILKHTCNEPCLRIMPCGHTYEHICKDCDGGKVHKACNEIILHPLPCLHNKRVKCSEKHLVYTCYEICAKRLICGHRCQSVCHKCDGGTFHDKCTEIISYQLFCGHEKIIKCFEKRNPSICCDNICSKPLFCGHSCNNICKECEGGTNHKTCKSNIQYELPCKHSVTIKCSDQTLKHICTSFCQMPLSCGHSCLSSCVDCLGGRLHKNCKSKCNLKLFCGHPCKDLCHSGECRNCIDHCFLSTVKNSFKRSRKYDKIVVGNWTKLKDSFNEELPYYGQKTFNDIINHLLKENYDNHVSKKFTISFKLYEKISLFFNEVFVMIDFTEMLEYKKYILNSICKLIEWINPLCSNVSKIDKSEFEFEFQRMKDLALVCQLNQSKGFDEIKINYTLLNKLIDAYYDEESQLQFKIEISRKQF